MSQEPTTPPPAQEPVDVIHAAVERLLIWIIQEEERRELSKSA